MTTLRQTGIEHYGNHTFYVVEVYNLYGRRLHIYGGYFPTIEDARKNAATIDPRITGTAYIVERACY